MNDAEYIKKLESLVKLVRESVAEGVPPEGGWLKWYKTAGDVLLEQTKSSTTYGVLNHPGRHD